MLDILLDAADNIPWDEVGEWALGVGLSALTIVGVDVGMRITTGKGLFGHMRSLVSGLEDKLNEWIRKQRSVNVYIKKIVFVVSSLATPVDVIDKGLNRVTVLIFGEDFDGRRHYSGQYAKITVKPAVLNELKNKKEIEAELSELGLG